MTRRLRARRPAFLPWLMSVLLVALASGCGLLGGVRQPEDVALDFVGAEGVERSEMIERVAYLFEEFAANERPAAVLDDAAFELELLLRERGFREARVESELVPRPGQKQLARFVIRPGVRTRLASIEFPGAAPEQFKAIEGVFWGDSESERWYSEAAVSGGARAVLRWYRRQGFVRVEVSEPEVAFNEDGTEARVRIPIEPGISHQLASVDVQLGAAITEPAPDPGAPTASEPASAGPVAVSLAEIQAVAKDRIGKPFDESVARLVRGRIGALFGERGYPDAQVTETSRDLDAGSVRLVYHVEPGPRVRIGAVRFEGPEATRIGFLEDRVELRPGEWYRRSAARESLANLSRSGLFDRVSIDLEKGGAAPTSEESATQGPTTYGSATEVTRDVVVELEEAPAREFFVEPGYGSYEGLRFGIGARERNLFGSGRTLDFEATVAELAQRADLSLIDPWILGSNATANLTIFWNRRQEPSFQRLEQGVELGASWRLSEEWRVRTSWQYRRSDASQIEVDAPEFVEDVDVSEFSVEPTWDTRDAFENPRKGHQTRAGADVSAAALGSQIEFLRLRLEHAHFVSFGSKLTLAGMGRLGVIAPVGDTNEIPIQERFFNGGENSVRSFRESQLGPKDVNGAPVGGEASTTFSVELRYLLAKRVQAALFVDAGDVALEYEDVFRFQDVGFGIGLGLRYLLPIGPVRVDGALNPDPEGNEATGAIHVSVGFAF